MVSPHYFEQAIFKPTRSFGSEKLYDCGLALEKFCTISPFAISGASHAYPEGDHMSYTRLSRRVLSIELFPYFERRGNFLRELGHVYCLPHFDWL
jgi:hypothetical protein